MTQEIKKGRWHMKTCHWPSWTTDKMNILSIPSHSRIQDQWLTALPSGGVHRNVTAIGIYKECISTILIIYERGLLESPRIKPDVLMPSVYMTSPPLKGSQSAWWVLLGSTGSVRTIWTNICWFYLLHVTPPLICIKRLESTALNGVIELSWPQTIVMGSSSRCPG